MLCWGTDCVEERPERERRELEQLGGALHLADPPHPPPPAQRHPPAGCGGPDQAHQLTQLVINWSKPRVPTKAQPDSTLR
jgi:hypothetical protein